MSSSGSLKLPDTSTVTDWPAVTVCAAISPTARGARLPCATLAANVCAAEAPSGSVAVTVMKADPGPTATSVTIEPSSETVATAASSVSTVKLSVSPSGSVKVLEMSRATVSPTARSWCGMVSVSVGPRFTLMTVMAASWVADSPSGSMAVMVIVAIPSATAMTVIIVPEIEAVSTVVSETAAS